MNGQTDKFTGNLPIDTGKVLKFGGIVFGITSVLITALAFLYYWLTF